MASRLLNALGFWLLAALAMALFVAATVPPLLRERAELARTEADMADALARMERQIDQHDQLLRQIRENDPLIANWLARERLNYELRAGRDVPLNPDRPDPAPTTTSAQPDSALDDSLQLSGLAEGTSAGPGITRDQIQRLLQKPTTQVWMLILAAVAITLALAFFGGRGPRRSSDKPPAGRR